MLSENSILLIVDDVLINIVSTLGSNFNVITCNLFNLKEQLSNHSRPDLFLFLNKDLSVVISTIKSYSDYFTNPLSIIWWPQNQVISTKDLINCSERGIEYMLTFNHVTQLNIAKIEGRLKANSTCKRIHYREAYLQGSNIGPKKDAETLDKVIGYLNEKNLDTNFSIEKMGTDLGMSRTKFFSKVKLLTGSSPSRMVMNYRLKKAACLITESDKNISDIAFEVGFSSTTYFTKCFKEKFGKSPSQYSKLKRQVIEIIDLVNVDIMDSSAQA